MTNSFISFEISNFSSFRPHPFSSIHSKNAKFKSKSKKLSNWNFKHTLKLYPWLFFCIGDLCLLRVAVFNLYNWGKKKRTGSIEISTFLRQIDLSLAMKLFYWFLRYQVPVPALWSAGFFLLVAKWTVPVYPTYAFERVSLFA